MIIHFIRFKLSKFYCWPCIAIYVANTRTTNSTTVHMADDDVEKVQWDQSFFKLILESVLHCIFTRYFFFNISKVKAILCPIGKRCCYLSKWGSYWNKDSSDITTSFACKGHLISEVIFHGFLCFKRPNIFLQISVLVSEMGQINKIKTHNHTN